MGPRTLCNPLYQRLGELLTAMRPLFAHLAPQDGSGGAALHQPLDATSKVLIKAQVYEVHSCEEILGEPPDCLQEYFNRIQLVSLQSAFAFTAG